MHSFHDASRIKILSEIRKHTRRLRRAGRKSIGFIYYSGHGAADAASGHNYLIPVDVKTTDDADILWDASVDLAVVLRILKRGAPDAAHFLVIDACRNELRLPGRSVTKGFAPIQDRRQRGLFIAFATEPDAKASDGSARDGNSPYAVALAAQLLKPGLDHLDLFQNVKEQVAALTDHRQLPWEQNGFLSRVCLACGYIAQPEPQRLPKATPLSRPATDLSATEITSICASVVVMRSKRALSRLAGQYKGSVIADCIADRLEELDEIKARRQAEEKRMAETKRQAEAEHRKAEAERESKAIAMAAEEAKRKLEEERRRLAKLRADDEEARRRAEAEQRRLAEEKAAKEARRKAESERKAEAEQRRLAKEAAKLKTEEAWHQLAKLRADAEKAERKVKAARERLAKENAAEDAQRRAAEKKRVEIARLDLKSVPSQVLAATKLPDLVAIRKRTTVPRSVAYNSKRNMIAVGGDDGIVRLFALPAWQLKSTFKFGQKRINDLDFSSDHKLLAGASYDGNVYIYDLEKLESKPPIYMSKRGISSVAFNPQYPDKYLAAGSRDGLAFAWDLKRSRFLTKNATFHKGAILDIAYNPKTQKEGSWFVSSGSDGKIRYRTSVRAGRKTVSAHNKGVFDINFAEDGTYMVSGGYDKLECLSRWLWRHKMLIFPLNRHYCGT